MLLLHLYRARSIKHAVRLMAGIAPTGVMTITRDSLLIKVRDEQHGIPVILYIDKQGFQISHFNEPQNRTITFQLPELDGILDGYGDNDPIRFRFDPDEHNVEFDVLRTLHATADNPPHQLNIAQYDITNMISFWFHPQQIQENLVNSWLQQTRYTLTGFSHTDLSQPLPPNFQPPPGLPQWKYSLAFRANQHISAANALSVYTGFHTGREPRMGEYRTPLLTFTLGDFSSLIFILPFESAVLPQVTWTIFLGN